MNPDRKAPIDLDEAERYFRGMTKRDWRPLGRGRQALVDSNGKIVGEISAAIGGGYHASRGGSLGTYIDEESAKRAVERGSA